MYAFNITLLYVSLCSVDMGSDDAIDLRQFGCVEKAVSAVIGRYFYPEVILEQAVNGIVIASCYGIMSVIIRVSDPAMKVSVLHLAMSPDDILTWWRQCYRISVSGAFEISM